jgi:hypothetical protein
MSVLNSFLPDIGLGLVANAINKSMGRSRDDYQESVLRIVGFHGSHSRGQFVDGDRRVHEHAHELCLNLSGLSWPLI